MSLAVSLQTVTILKVIRAIHQHSRIRREQQIYMVLYNNFNEISDRLIQTGVLRTSLRSSAKLHGALRSKVPSA